MPMAEDTAPRPMPQDAPDAMSARRFCVRTACANAAAGILSDAADSIGLQE